MKSEKFFGILLKLGIIVILGGLFKYFAVPVYNLKSLSFIILLYGILFISPIMENFALIFNMEIDSEKYSKMNLIVNSIIAFALIINLGYAYHSFIKTPGEKVQRYNRLDYEISESFEANFDEQGKEDIILLNEKEALRVAKTLVPDGGLYNISSGTLNQVKENGENKFYWAFPLKHGSLKRALGETGTTGFIKVDATQLETGEFVEQDILISDVEIFGQNLLRVLKNNKAVRGDFFQDVSFEINDEGEGRWVVTRFNYSNGTVFKDIKGVSIVNPTTREISHYAIEDTPKWVDRIYPADVFFSRVTLWAKNDRPYFEGGTKSIEERNYYVKDGKLNFYAEITSSKSDEKLLGFMLFSPKTGKTTYFELDGKLSKRVKEDIDGVVEEVQYHPEDLRIINVANIPTYFTKIKYEESIVGYAFGSLKQGTTAVAWGKTIEEAKANYINAYFNNENVVDANSTIKEKSQSGVISRIGLMNTEYYLLKLEGDKRFYKVHSGNFPSVILTKAGDNVKLTYLDQEDDKTLEVKDLLNLNIK